MRGEPVEPQEKPEPEGATPEPPRPELAGVQLERLRDEDVRDLPEHTRG